jgi:hypothetical protein
MWDTGYVAPELLEKIPTIGNAICGACCVFLLGGYAPFEEPDQRTLFSKIVTADYDNSMKNTGLLSR